MIKVDRKLILTQLIFTALIEALSAQCTLCYNDGPGYDPLLMYLEEESGEMRKCSELNDTVLPFLGPLGADLCPFFQQIGHDSCGCKDAPPSINEDCPICYENEPGFDETLVYPGIDGESASCADLRMMALFTNGDPTACSFNQLLANLYCGCSSSPPEIPENSLCPLCYDNEHGFDPTLEFTDENGEKISCFALQLAALYEDENKDGTDTCASLQLAAELYCGCPTTPTAPTSGSCPICYDNGPGFDPLLQFIDDEGKTVACSILQLPTLDLEIDSADCARIQTVANQFCGCSTIPDSLVTRAPILSSPISSSPVVTYPTLSPTIQVPTTQTLVTVSPATPVPISSAPVISPTFPPTKADPATVSPTVATTASPVIDAPSPITSSSFRSIPLFLEGTFFVSLITCLLL